MRTLTSQPIENGARTVLGVVGGTLLGDGGPRELYGFEGDTGETLLIVEDGRRFLLVGMGESVDTTGVMNAAATAARVAGPGEDLVSDLHRVDLESAAEAAALGFLLGSYRFDRYKSQSNGESSRVSLADIDPETLERVETLASAVAQARDWVNTAPVDKAPADLAEEMEQDLVAAGFDVEVWDESRIRDEGLGGLVGVAAGSARPPRMVVARRAPRQGALTLALVGKGIVFDSGGLSIKSPENMATMKCDMAGAAAVVAGACAIGRLRVDIETRVYVPLTDNMSGGNALKLGDVLKCRNGKTIEVLNTDAEGRLVLADALSLAVEEEPGLVVDLATLTGASRVALGDHIASVFSDGEAGEKVEGAAAVAGERVWPLPLPADYRKLIDSKVADMKNTGGRYGGAIAAALLLKEFVGDTPWAHLDIAGPAWAAEDGPLGPVGGTGFGVRTLVALAEQLAQV